MKTWNLTLTPEGTPSKTLTGLSANEAAAVLRDLMGGTDPRDLARTTAKARATQHHEQSLAA